jgi:hypothetical protein
MIPKWACVISTAQASDNNDTGVKKRVGSSEKEGKREHLWAFGGKVTPNKEYRMQKRDCRRDSCGAGCSGEVGVFNESQEHRDFVMYPGFSIDVSDMGLYCTSFNIDDFGNFFIVKTLADKFGNLELSVRHAKAFSYIRPLLFGQQDDLGWGILSRAAIIGLVIHRWL